MIHSYRFYFFLLANILLTSACASDNELSCVYTPKQSTANPYPELSQYSNCASIDEHGKIKFNRQTLNNIFDANANSLATVHINKSYYYVNRSGKSARTIMFDNGADYFESGLARTKKNNKYGYINKNLDIVIAPQYDFAFPFKGKHARVCNGCIPVKTGEHHELRGGKWGYINQRGKVVTPVKYKRDELPALAAQ